ncbi:MAG: GGDEF domain-containing protein [Myxococcaceae bacterium]
MARGLNSVGKKLLWGIALPALVVAVAGVTFYWRQVDRAVRDSTRDEAAALAELISTTFNLTAQTAATPGASRPSPVHRSVTEAFRSDWKMFRHVSHLRVLDGQGIVRWSRKVEEEGKPLPGAERLLAAGSEAVVGERGRAEVVRPLGGLACAGCHAGVTNMKVGVVQLAIDEPSLQREVTRLFGIALWSVLGFMAVVTGATVLSLHFFLTRPLRRLSETMRRAEEGDFLARAQAGSRDELGTLGSSFNRMLARITSMKAEEIDTHRDLAAAQEQLVLKQTLENTNAKLENRVTELSTLYDVARQLNATLELPELFARITKLVPTRLRIPQFSIMLVNAEGKLEVKSAHPEGRGVGITFEIGEGACGRAAATLESVYIPDLEAERGIFRVRAGTQARSGGSLLALPMVHMGELLGVLNFEQPVVKAGFSAEEIEVLSAVTDQAATAVKNAKLHEQTVALSITDPLTGIANRRHLFSRLEMEIARANRFGNQVSMLMIDIDYFKKLNDAAGHRAGDEVLRAVCDLMKGMIRKVDTLARYGGEEFVIILPQVTKTEAIEVAQKLRRSVEELPSEHRHVQPGGRITISVGVSNLPVDSTEEEKLVDCSDSALYASKRAGRNQVTGYAAGMELHPGRERGPHTRRTKTGETPAAMPAVAKPS